MFHYQRPRRIPPRYRAVPDRRYLEVALVVGDRLRRLRLDRGLTLLQLAARIEKPGGGSWSASTLSRLERGWAHAPLFLYIRLAEELEVEPWRLFADDAACGSPSPEELMLLRLLDRAGIPPDEALARVLEVPSDGALD